MAVIWSPGVPACLLASHRFEGILSPAASVNLMDPEQHRKSVESTCSCLDKRLYEAFIIYQEIAESHSWIGDLLFTSLCDFLQALLPVGLQSTGLLCCSLGKKILKTRIVLYFYKSFVSLNAISSK